MSKLSEEQVTELKTAFAAMDTNGDGQVTKEELKALLSTLGESVDDAVIDEMIKIADVNGDGKVDFNEFVKAATEWLVNNLYIFENKFMLFISFFSLSIYTFPTNFISFIFVCFLTETFYFWNFIAFISLWDYNGKSIATINLNFYETNKT